MLTRHLSRIILFGVSLVALAEPRPAMAQVEVDYPVCMIDSVSALAGDLSDILHPFGDDTITYPNEFDLADFPAFSQVFDLYVSDGVSDRWDQSEWEALINAIMNADTTTTGDDVFGVVWGYFVRDEADENASSAGVRFTIGATTYTRIALWLYDVADLPSPCTSGYGSACNGYSFYFPGTNRIVVNASPANSLEVVRGLGIGHELQHLCWAANGLGSGAGFYSANETMSTLAEYLIDSWRPHYYDISYDASTLRAENCDQDSKYEVEKMWISYLYEVFKGNGADPTDDLVYRWIRSDLGIGQRMKLSGLAGTLWDDDFDWLGGADATERLSNAFANYLVAKFANAPAFGENGEFGAGSINTVQDFGLFLDNCTSYFEENEAMTPVDCPGPGGYPPGNVGCWNVRILIPEYEVTDDQENTLTTVSGIYEDGDAQAVSGDGSKDYIDVAQYGTDYVVFRAGEYYNDDAEHELEIRLGGSAKNKSPGYPEASRIKPVGWVIGYCCDEASLQEHPEDILFVEPFTFSPSTTLGDTVLARPVIVTDFGRSVKAVVLAVGATSTAPSTATIPLNYFVYEYDFGAYTPAASARTWEGDVYVLGDVTVPENGTLEIDAGTYVKVFNSDLASTGADEDRVELNVDGELIVSGTAEDPVTIHPWTQTTSEDWAGIYFSADSDGGTFDYCTVGYAEFVIDSYAPIEINNSTIRGASDALVSIWSSTLEINDSEIALSNGDCIRLDDSDATIDGTLIEECVGYGVYMSGNGALNITDSQVLDADVGVYVENNTTNGTISETRFEDNDVGISYYNSTKPTIDECVITGNTHGIDLDYFSSPSILHCMTSASYSGNITSNGSGIMCSDNSDPTVGYCNISSNNTGVLAVDDSEPDLDGYGANKFTSNSAYHVANLVTGTTVPATGNYWLNNTGSPNYYPNSARILGSVDYTGALSSGPNPVSPRPEPFPEPETVVVGLGRAHPNPFNPTVQIPYGVANPSDVRIDIFDVNGRLVRTLVDDRKERGNHVVVWDGTTNSGSPTASAVYFVRMRAERLTQTQKIVLLK
jgi:hypothetical protein